MVAIDLILEPDNTMVEHSAENRRKLEEPITGQSDTYLLYHEKKLK